MSLSVIKGLLVTCALALISAFSNEPFFKYMIPYLYFSQFVAFLWMLRRYYGGWQFLFFPSNLCLIYVTVSFILGSYALNNEFVLRIDWAHKYDTFTHLRYSTAYFLACNFFLFWCSFIIHPYESHPRIEFVYNSSMSRMLVGFISIFALFSVVTLNLTAFGGNKDMSIVPQLVGLIGSALILAGKKARFRIFFYTVLLTIISIQHYDDKRSIILSCFIIAFIELVHGNVSMINFNAKKTILYSFLILGGVYSIIVLSIFRGFGGYSPRTIVEAASLVPEYLDHGNFEGLLFHNLEVYTTYYHSSNSIEFVRSEPELHSLGSTIGKVLFIPIPRSIFPEKPSSMIDLYTAKMDRYVREDGKSSPINIYAESYWNFNFLGILYFVILFLGFNSLYKINLCRNRKITVAVFRKILITLFIYLYLIILFRGSGLDIFTVHVVIALVFTYLVSLFGRYRYNVTK